MKRRILKKQVKNDFNDLLFLYYLIHTQESPATRQEIKNVLDRRWDYVSRISHTEPGNARKYYRKLYQDLTAELDTLTQKYLDEVR